MTHISIRRNATLVALVAGIGLIAFATREMLRAETVFSTTAQAEQGLTVKAGKDTIFFCINKETIKETFPLMDSTLASEATIRFSVEEYTAKAAAETAKRYVSGATDNDLTEFRRGKLYIVRTDRDLFFRCNDGLRLLTQATAFRPIAIPSVNPVGQTASAPKSSAAAAPLVSSSVFQPSTQEPIATCPALMCDEPVVPQGCQYVLGRDANGCPTCGGVVCAQESPLVRPAASDESTLLPINNPLEIILSSPPDDYTQGSIVQMIFDIRNTGDTPLDRVKFSLAMPEGYAIPVGGTSGNCSGNGHQVSCQNLVIAGKEKVHFSFPFVVQAAAKCGALEMTRVVAAGHVQNGSDTPQTYSNFAAWSVDCGSSTSAASTSSAAQSSTVMSFGNLCDINPAACASSSSKAPETSSSYSSAGNGLPLSVSLSGPNGLQKNTSATYTLVLKNTTTSTTLQNVSFNFPLPTGITTEGQSTMPNCSITANMMSCSGLVLQAQLSLTLSLPVKTLNTLPCQKIPLTATANAAGFVIRSNTIDVQGCSGGSSSSSVTVLTSITAPLGYLPKNTPLTMQATVAAFSTPFTDGVLRIIFPEGFVAGDTVNSLQVGTCHSHANAIECSGMSRGMNQGAVYQFPFSISDAAACGRGEYTMTFTYKDQGIEKQMTKVQGMQLCTATPVETGPLDRFSITTGTAACVSSDCRTVSIPVTLRNSGPTPATNTMVIVNLDTSWSSATLNGVPCMIVDLPTARMFDCPRSPYLTVPAGTSLSYTLVLTTDVQCPATTARTAVLVQSAPASVYEQDYSNNSVYVTIPAACTQGPVASSSSSSSSLHSSSVSSSPAATSSASSFTVAATTVLESIKVIKVTPTIPYGDTVVIRYQKSHDVCVHLQDANNQKPLNQNVLCDTREGPVTVFLSDMNSNFAVGNSYALCHSNNGNDCSNSVMVSEEQSTASHAGDLISISQTGAGSSGNQCLDGPCSRLLMTVALRNKSTAIAEDINISATVDASWSAATIKGLPCTLRSTTALGGRRTFDCPGITVAANSPLGLTVGLVLTRTAACPVSGYQANAILEFTPGTSYATAYPTDALFPMLPLPCQPSSSVASSSVATSSTPSVVTWNSCNVFEKLPDVKAGPNTPGGATGWPSMIGSRTMTAAGIDAGNKVLLLGTSTATLARYTPETNSLSNKMAFQWTGSTPSSQVYYEVPVSTVGVTTVNNQQHAWYWAVGYAPFSTNGWALYDMNLDTKKTKAASYTYTGAPQNPAQYTPNNSDVGLYQKIITTWNAAKKRMYYFGPRDSILNGNPASQIGYFDVTTTPVTYNHIGYGPVEQPAAAVSAQDGNSIYVLYNNRTVTFIPPSIENIYTLYTLNTITGTLTKILTLPSSVTGLPEPLKVYHLDKMLLDDAKQTLYILGRNSRQLLSFSLATNTLSVAADIPAEMVDYLPFWYEPQKGMYLMDLREGHTWRYRSCP